MSDRLLVDTNIVIYGLKGVPHIKRLLNKRSIYISFITEIELLSYSKNTTSDLQLIELFLDSSYIIEYAIPIKKTVIDIRKRYNLKTADVFVAASAIEYNLPLISADAIFGRISQINFFKVNP